LPPNYVRLDGKKWLEMIEAFLKLTPEERVAEAEKRLDETLERMAGRWYWGPVTSQSRMSLIIHCRQVFVKPEPLGLPLDP